MRQLYKIAALGAVGLILTGCADNTIDYINVEQPQGIAEYEYLDAYAPLKEYIDRAAHPGFLLGTAISANDYINKGMIYRLTNSNFDIITAGNEMKYASIVNDQGVMDFSTVESFVEAAEAAGMQIYGHTLCWHAQQNVKWLNSLIADKEIEIDPDAKEDVTDKLVKYSDFTSYPYYVMWRETDDENSPSKAKIENGLLVIDNQEPKDANWQGQYFVIDGAQYQKGSDYLVTAKIRCSQPGTLTVVAGDWGGNVNTELDFDTEWKEVTVTLRSVPAESGFVTFQSGACPGKLEIEWVKLHHLETPVLEIGVDLLGGDATGAAENPNLIAREPGMADYAAKIVADPDDAANMVYASPFNANPSTEWDSQFFIRSNESLPAGTKIHVKFRYRATEDRAIDTQAHGAPGSYHHYDFIGTLNAKTEWQTHEYTGTISDSQAGSEGCSSIAFNLCKQATAGTLYIDDVVFEKLISANSIPISPEEKEEILTNEMERWVKGMMEACGGKVKYWDVVNEAISGGGGDRYDLQHGPGNGNDFFWQDYLGDNFVRVPVRFARQYFEESGGNSADLKLFINDYNLESDWDDNKKLKSLISWIEQWESDGETKIDGIGTQMHISYYMNPQTQKSKEDHIVKMFELMAASGKLCRITELDMGLVDANGQSVHTADITFEQQQLMADHYKWIVEKYFEIIPVAQQFGITHWCQTDSPENSGWRANEPVGLWNSNFNRKPAYGGFADGLQGK